MTLVQDAPWIDQLADWISEKDRPESKKELNVLLNDLEIAIARADSLVECSNQLQRVARNWTVKNDKFEENVSNLHS